MKPKIESIDDSMPLTHDLDVQIHDPHVFTMIKDSSECKCPLKSHPVCTLHKGRDEWCSTTMPDGTPCGHDKACHAESERHELPAPVAAMKTALIAMAVLSSDYKGQGGAINAGITDLLDGHFKQLRAYLDQVKK